MKKYEIMVIIANDVKESEAEKQAQTSVDERIKGLGGKLTFQDFWGAKGFAYKIKKQTWGYYYVAQFEIEPSKINEFRNELNIDAKVVRFLISNVEANDPAPQTLEQIKTAHAQREQEAKIQEAESPKKAPAKKVEKKTETPKKAEPKKDAVDKKLDQIIEDSTADL